MIQIDDAGWGSLVGGVLIGVYRDTDRAFRFDEVAPLFFQGDRYLNKDYLQEAGTIALRLLMELGVPRSEEIFLCTGYCLDGVYSKLLEHGYCVSRGKITGPLQDKIEHTLRTVLECKYSFKVTYEELTSLEKKGLFWWKQIHWLKDGNIDRHGFNNQKSVSCKTGWSTWPAWSKLPYSMAGNEAKRLKTKAHWNRRYG